jgi:ATP-dependent DNA ligase
MRVRSSWRICPYLANSGSKRPEDSVKAKIGFIEPMLALAVTKLPEGPDWSYELKFDGYRAFGVKTEGKVRLLSRNGKDFTKRFVSIARALEALPDETVIDGEIIAYDADGRPSFNVLQNHRAGPELHLFAFDLLTLRGESLMREPLEKRRELFANQGDAAAAGFDSLLGNHGGIAGRTDRGST